MSDEILPVPHLPPGLKEAALRGRLIPFVGAGASMIAGCPSWSEFADRTLRFFIEQNKFTHGQLDQIKSLNPRVKLTLARSLQAEHKLEINFKDALYPTDAATNPKGRRLYESLSKLGKTFVTTNYDEWLDTEIGARPVVVGETGAPEATATTAPRSVFHKVSDLTAANLNRPNSVLHLHGSVLDPSKMILTTQDYVRHYANDRMNGDVREENFVLTFLDDLFSQKTVLFIGYGLEELEILEYVIVKAKLREDEGDSREIRHYLLQGFFSHERELLRIMTLYYQACGIQLIPFLRDLRNWDQLIEVLEAFAKQAPASEPMKLERLAQMEALLNG